MLKLKIPINLIGYVAVFGLARGSLFLAPIIVSNLLSVEAYGKIELAQATGSIAALLLGLGLPGTVPLILVRRDVRARWDTLLFYMAGMALLLFGFFLGALLYAPSAFSFWVLAPLVTALLLLQGLWSVTLKTYGRSTLAVILETGFWLAAMTGAALIYFLKLGEAWVVGALALASVMLITMTLVQYLVHRKPFTLSDVFSNISLGWPLMITSLFTLAATTAGRIILGQTSGVEAVGVYSVLFRATALPIVVHQILIIGFFRHLFVWEMSTLRRRTPIIIWGISLSIVFFLILVGPFGWLLGPRFIAVFSLYPQQGKILLFLTVLWSAIALNDLLNSRAHIAGRVTYWTGPYLALALLVIISILLTKDGMDDPTIALPMFVPLYAVLMLGYYTIQCWAMYRLGSTYFRLWGSAFIAFLLGIGFLFFQELII